MLLILCFYLVFANPAPILAGNPADKIYRCSQHQIPQQLMDQPWFDLVSMQKNHFLDFRVKTEEQLNQVHAWLNVTTGDCQVRVDNLQQLIRIERRPAKSQSSNMRLTADKIEEQFFNEFRSNDFIIGQMKKYAQNHPQLARLNPSIGQSHEKRHLAAMHITSSSNKGSKKTKPVIWINGGLHAREWITISSAMYLIHSLINDYQKNDAQAKKLLDELEFVIVPVGNPDGYEFSRNSSSPDNRMWRKNRRKNVNGTFGVDLNRNFDFKWAGEGSSAAPVSNVYHGPSPASEPEVQAIQNYLNRVRPVAGVDLHSYGQLILRPYSYTYENHTKEALFKKLGDGMQKAIRSSSNMNYTSQKSSELYPVGGSLDDWMTVKFGLGMTMELPDYGDYGFILPTKDIIPTGKDVMVAVKHLGQFVLDNKDEIKIA